MVCPNLSFSLNAAAVRYIFAAFTTTQQRRRYACDPPQTRKPDGGFGRHLVPSLLYRPVHSVVTKSIVSWSHPTKPPTTPSPLSHSSAEVFSCCASSFFSTGRNADLCTHKPILLAEQALSRDNHQQKVVAMVELHKDMSGDKAYERARVKRVDSHRRCKGREAAVTLYGPGNKYRLNVLEPARMTAELRAREREHGEQVRRTECTCRQL